MTTEALDGGRDANAPEPTVVGNYRLIDQLGVGGMGVVHLALDRQGKAVALKLLRPHIAADDDARARLQREVDALRRIRGPHIAPIIDAELDSARPFIVTRYVPGTPLDDAVSQSGALRTRDLHRVADGLAQAIDAIHGAGVIHRDIKPGNVMLVEGDPVLIDFGIAHLVDDVRLTATGLVMGTPGYLAPEIVEGERVSRATDWWGWAATLAFAATGRPPFGRGPMDAVLARVSRGEPDLSGVDPRLAPLLYAALSPSAHDRPHHREVVAGLHRFSQGGAVTEAVELRRDLPATEQFAMPRTSVLPQAGGQARRPESPAASVPPAPVARPVIADPQPAKPAWEQPRPPERPYPAVNGDPAKSAGTAYPFVGPDGRALDPETGQPLGPSPDPRIGRAARSGTIAALLAAVCAGCAVAPLPTLASLLVGLVLARTADRSVTSLVLRRHDRGERRSDLPVAVLAGPWHLVLGIVGGLFSLLLPALIAASAFFCTALAEAAVWGNSEVVPVWRTPVALAVAGLFGALTLWWGPGGASTRRGTRSLIRGISPAASAPLFTIFLLVLAVGLLVWGLLVHGGTTWWPGTEPTWLSFSSVT